MGQLVPTDVAARMRPWVVDASPSPATPNPSPEFSLDQEAERQQAFFKSFGGRSLAAPEDPAYAAVPPWIQMPGGGQPYFNQKAIVCPANDGLDHTVLSFLMAPGWDGIIDKLANFYTGPGFIIGSGDLTWRVERNGQAVKGFEQIVSGLGQYGQGGMVPLNLDVSPIRIFSGETISYVVNHATTSGLPFGVGVNIFCVIGGYFYSKS